VPPLPVLLVVVATGALLLLRLVGGSMPWGKLTIAVGPDGRPMRPRLKWHLWTICRGDPPLMTAVFGSVSVVLGSAAIYFLSPELAETIVKPEPRWLVYLLMFTLGASSTVVPVGVVVLVRGLLDLAARRSSMVGVVVSMRRDIGLFGRTYRVAIQSGDRMMAKKLWAEAFRISRETFDRLQPGDRITIEYSPHLYYVYDMVLPEPLKKAAG
jgi:hypothetical protein